MADTKITGLTEDTSPSSSDIVPTVKDPGGTPLNRKVTLANLLRIFPRYPADGRLTLTTATPVTTADVTAATTLYYTPYIGSAIALFNGINWDILSFAELSLNISAYTAGKNYDIWVYNNSGTAALDSTVWSNDTTRATALAYQDGVLCKTGALTRRYLGTIRITASTGQCEDSLLRRYVWNYYNRRVRKLHVTDTTGSWTYNSDTIRQSNAATANKVEIVCGVSEDMIEVLFNQVVLTGNSAIGTQIGIGVNVTNAFSGFQGYTRSTVYTTVAARYEGYSAAGYNYYACCEALSSTGTNGTYLGGDYFMNMNAIWFG